MPFYLHFQFTFFCYSSDLSRITVSKVVLIVSTVLGLAIMFNPTVDNYLTDTLIGISLVLLSAVFWALFIIYSKRAVSNISPTIFTSTYMCITTVILFFGAIINGATFTTFSDLQTYTIIYLALLAVFCSIIPSYLMSFGLKRINASLAAIISAMGPIVTLSLDVVVLNHNLTLNEIIGAIIVTACVTCLTSLNAKA